MVSVNSNEFKIVLNRLTPAQRYVVYVEANTVRRNSVGALSNFQFFTTLTAGNGISWKCFFLYGY